MDTLNLKHLALETPRLDQAIGLRKLKLPRHQAGEKFLKGPIPWSWLVKAACLPGRSLHVAIALWFLAGLGKTPTVKLGQKLASELGIDRHAKDRALHWLIEAGLIRVSRTQGCAPVVTLLNLNSTDMDQGEAT
jgi:hypothetical protein